LINYCPDLPLHAVLNLLNLIIVKTLHRGELKGWIFERVLWPD
jgi:hypothetical protein